MIHSRCAKCLMPSSYPGIEFDENGVCSLCLAFEKKKLLGRQAFLKKLRSRPRGKYDCVLGISGGKDSCYVAYLAQRELGLSALAVFYDFPFLRDLARQNVRNVCDALQMDLVTVRSKSNLEYDLLRNHLISMAPTGTTWGQCVFCHYGIDAVLYQAAKSKGIRFILSGITENELWNPGNRARTLLGRVRRLPITELSTLAYYQLRAYLGLVEQRRQFRIPANRCFATYARARMPSDDVEIISVFDYFAWDQSRIERILTEEAGWTKPHRPLSWRYDCVLEPLLDYTYKKEFGISTVGLYLSGLVRSGLVSREEALSVMEESDNDEALGESVAQVFDYLKIPKRLQDKFFSS